MALLHIDGICLDGFSQPITIDELRRTRCSGVPESPGAYLIVRSSDSTPDFLSVSTGGWFKGQDPNAPLDVVRAHWVQGAHVLYVGMTAARKGLKGRLCCFFDFGCGKAVGHRGGRLLWHLKDSGELLVRWRPCAEAEADDAETKAIADFKAAHDGRRPYANMNK
jgi:hypothetical protein